MKSTITIVPAVLIAGAIALLALVFLFTQQPSTALGSVSRASEYQGTTTSQGFFNPEISVVSGNGTLGQVTITGAAAGLISIYDATTSNVNLRTGNKATSTILIASFPASAAVGTYTFDRVFFDGMYVSITGTIPTSTITYR